MSNEEPALADGDLEGQNNRSPKKKKTSERVNSPCEDCGDICSDCSSFEPGMLDCSYCDGSALDCNGCDASGCDASGLDCNGCDNCGSCGN